MSYVEKVLLPDEKVLFVARVTPALYLPGFSLVGLGVLIAYYCKDLDKAWYFLARLGRWLKQYLPDIVIDQFALNASAVCLLMGLALIVRAYVICFWTELAITDRRVIAKYGVVNTFTTEIDRRKIAGVVIFQSPWGKLFGYGLVTLRGYSGHIAGLPPISHPYDFQKEVNQRIRW